MNESPLTAGDLLGSGYYQVSARYRTLARLPSGKTGIEALIDACRTRYEEFKGTVPQDFEKWAKRMGEGHAGDQFLRCYATDKVTVNVEVFKQYKMLGGGTYDAKHWTDGVISTQVGCPLDGLVLKWVEEGVYECGDGHIVTVSMKART